MIGGGISPNMFVLFLHKWRKAIKLWITDYLRFSLCICIDNIGILFLTKNKIQRLNKNRRFLQNIFPRNCMPAVIKDRSEAEEGIK